MSDDKWMRPYVQRVYDLRVEIRNMILERNPKAVLNDDDVAATALNATMLMVLNQLQPDSPAQHGDFERG